MTVRCRRCGAPIYESRSGWHHNTTMDELVEFCVAASDPDAGHVVAVVHRAEP